VAEPKKKSPGFFQRLAGIAKDFVEWVEATFGDAELAAEIKDDLGMNPANPATPKKPAGNTLTNLESFAAKQDIDEAALIAVVADLKAAFGTVMDFVEAAKADGVDARTLFTAIFRMFALDVLRVRNPAGYALVRLVGLVTDDDEGLEMLDASRLSALLRGSATPADGEKWVQRLSSVLGMAAVLAAIKWDAVAGTIDALYGWDPAPDDEAEAAVIAGRALTVILESDELHGIQPAITIVGVPAAHGGPGIFVSITSAFRIELPVGDATLTIEVAGATGFGVLIPFSLSRSPEFAGTAAPSIRVSLEPKRGSSQPSDAPAVVIGPKDGSRLQIGALTFGVEIDGDSAGVRLGVRKGRIVFNLDSGDGFLSKLPGGDIDIPFEIGLLLDTVAGARFDGGTGVKAALPVSASVLGAFTVQFLEFELTFQPTAGARIVGGFSVKLGPFAASVDRVGVSFDLAGLTAPDTDVAKIIGFVPPKGIGLVLDTGVVKGGGYLFIDNERGEYAGALELKFLSFSIKAIALLSTKRPDGSEGWSLLIFVFGQFNIHIAFGIFWTGLGGMIGLHHRADLDALTAGMRTGALDDVLFPADPVKDAPRIINRYRTLFPVEENNLLLGPMLELSFSQPPIVFIRLGLIFDLRNALGGSEATALSKVILVGQILVQLPPKATGVPAILKLLIDVVGYYDADTDFMLIRARLRDSFVGIEGFVKLDLAGEFLFAASFGADPSFVISAGGFHPKYEGLPERVPRDLDRLKVSFKIGPVKLSVEQYFAVTPNSVQAGQKAMLKADFGVGVEASLSWDALLYLSPRFYFVVDVEFNAKITAFGETLMAVKVRASIEGPDRWHVSGEFSFSILWWDKSISFDESWGAVETADSGSTSIAAMLAPELSNSDNLTVEAPSGGSSVVTLAPATTGTTVGHPLGRLAIRQRAVPFDLTIDRIGTKSIGGAQSVTVASVAVNETLRPNFATTTTAFARGQFMALTDEEKLTGKVLEDFRNGVVVGEGAETTDDARATQVTAAFETVRLDPVPAGVLKKWATVRIGALPVDIAVAVAASRVGAAARSQRGVAAVRVGRVTDAATVLDPPLTLVAPDTMAVSASLFGANAASVTLAAQTAAVAGLHLVEAFEVG